MIYQPTLEQLDQQSVSASYLSRTVETAECLRGIGVWHCRDRLHNNVCPLMTQPRSYRRESGAQPPEHDDQPITTGDHRVMYSNSGRDR
jgi:hypothetical protein